MFVMFILTRVGGGRPPP